VSALIRPLFDRSAWAHTATVVAGMRGKGAVLASVSMVGLGSAMNCGEGTKGECAALGPVL
jgi:hypothetical protein